MLPRKYRLTKPADFYRAHSKGQAWSNRMLVLCRHPNGLADSRFGFSVSKRLGNAVVRNRIKRLLREAVKEHRDLFSPGWDVLLIALRGITGADYGAVESSVLDLASVARLLNLSDETSTNVSR